MTDKKKDEDLVAFGARDDGGIGYVRKRNGTYETGVAHTAQEGKPIQPDSEIVAVTKRDDGWWNIDDIHAPVAKTAKGPAKVSTPAYRDGWDHLWGKQSRELN